MKTSYAVVWLALLIAVLALVAAGTGLYQTGICFHFLSDYPALDPGTTGRGQFLVFVALFSAGLFVLTFNLGPVEMGTFSARMSKA